MRPTPALLLVLALMGFSMGVLAQKGDRKGHVMKDPIPAKDIPPAPVLSVEEALASMRLQPGFTLECVASEPWIFSPVAMVFDGEGRMWVCEMNTYMPNVDGKGEEVPKGRIVVLEDRDGDGKVDHRTVFVDDVILPRTVSLVKGGILYADHRSLWFAEVREGALGPSCGLREIVDKDYAKGGSLEHKTNTMLYAMDNWYYNAKSNKRYRALPLERAVPVGSTEIYRNAWFKMVRGRTDYRGQWGLSMDDQGRLYHNGNSSPATGEYLRPGSLLHNPRFRPRMGSSRIGGLRVYPIRINPGVNRAYMKGILTKDGKLARFTAASGNVVYRGDNFPERFYGMSVTPEPAGNLLSARQIIESEGRLGGRELYKGSEILASTDERFRPVNLYTAPDGTIYILDMYHGILQHKEFVTTYLRKQILSRGLDRHNNTMGRIYRLRWKAKAAGPEPRLSARPSAELVALLGHDNGWWRDMARQLLVQRQDHSVVDALVALCRKSADPRARIEALWTLEGLGAVTLDAVAAGLDRATRQPRVAGHAIAVSGSLRGKDLVTLSGRLARLSETAPYPLALEVALAAGRLAPPYDLVTARHILERFADKRYVREALLSGLAGKEQAFVDFLGSDGDPKFLAMTERVLHPPKKGPKSPKLRGRARALYLRGKRLFSAGPACVSCHGPAGQGMPTLGPPLVQSEWVEGSAERFSAILLHGLTGKILVRGKTYESPTVMPGLGANASISDIDLAAIQTYVRNSWGNRARPVTEAQVRRARRKTRDRQVPYDMAGLAKEFSR